MTNDFYKMQKAGTLAREVLDYIEPFVKEGITTDELNSLCHDYIIAHNAIPAPLNYKGFPKSICTSVNDVICHGIPSMQKLCDGNIINIDVTVILDGWYGDTSRTFPVGNCSKEALDLIKHTYNAMMIGINHALPGNRLGDIGHAIQSYVEPLGYSVVRDFCGHGIGREFHLQPDVLHYGKKGTGPILHPGMCITIEPMINIGTYHSITLDDGWTAVTVDGKLSAQFEHTIGITQKGNVIFTI